MKAAATGLKQSNQEHALAYSMAHKEHSSDHKEHSKDKDDKSEAILNMLVGAVLSMDARMKRMEEMLEMLVKRS